MPFKHLVASICLPVTRPAQATPGRSTIPQHSSERHPTIPTAHYSHYSLFPLLTIPTIPTAHKLHILPSGIRPLPTKAILPLCTFLCQMSILLKHRVGSENQTFSVFPFLHSASFLFYRTHPPHFSFSNRSLSF